MDQEEKLKWRLGTIFVTVNLFIIGFAAASIILFGVWTGLFMTLVVTVFSIYLVYSYFLSKEFDV